MINTTELRIGNIIKHAGTGSLGVVIEICPFGVKCKFSNELTYIDAEEYEPIAVTEEWLKNFGFIEEPENEFVVRFNQLVFIIHKNLITGEFICMSVLHYSFRIKKVHQLQNLFFALTGKELSLVKDFSL